MTETEAVGACLATAIGLIWLASKALDWWIRRNSRFQRTARKAARTETTVAEDAADRRKQREVALLEAWLQTPCHPRNTIPHQTRRTEEDQ
ncbi:hypothetical protein [Streptomyces katrae]|uniref:hypothetical protein n=1 Tax=Streptomyces katrae TaxID=68223 RepID=UPI0004C1D834|nr:hypothetical protein [Streptomyces katrae]